MQDLLTSKSKSALDRLLLLSSVPHRHNDRSMREIIIIIIKTKRREAAAAVRPDQSPSSPHPTPGLQFVQALYAPIVFTRILNNTLGATYDWWLNYHQARPSESSEILPLSLSNRRNRVFKWASIYDTCTERGGRGQERHQIFELRGRGFTVQ